MRLLALLLVCGTAFTLSAETIDGMGGQLQLEVPKEWQKTQPRIRMIEHEYALPGEEGKGRLTMMAASGSIKDNIDRWIGQFAGAESKVEKFSAGPKTVHFVEITGTFKERMGGPFAGGRTVERPDYGMLGAIIVDGDGTRGGKYFIKATGPEQVIEKHKDAFKKMLKELKTQE